MALVIGYHIWLIISSWVPAYRWVDVPLCFYNTSEHINIDAPESVRIMLAGSRLALANLDIPKLAVHIDTHTLINGKNSLILSDHQLLLPSQLHVVDWSPSNVIIGKQAVTDNQG